MGDVPREISLLANCRRRRGGPHSRAVPAVKGSGNGSCRPFDASAQAIRPKVPELRCIALPPSSVLIVMTGSEGTG